MILVFSSPGTKCQVRYCERAVSGVVCRVASGVNNSFKQHLL